VNSSFFRRAGFTVLASALLAAALPATAAGAARTPSGARDCRETLVPVDTKSALLQPGGSGTENSLEHAQVFVRYCQPAGKPSSTVQVLVHGITYDHTYWDIPDPDGGDRYSWEAAAAKAGYATLAIDRIGAGKSSHPTSYQVDINSNAAVVKAVVHALRSGKILAPTKVPVPVQKVVLVGHSYGSMTSWFAASNNPEVDAVVLTGATHNIREVESPTRVSSPLYPSFLDPKFRYKAYDPGYLTIRPGTRPDPYYLPDKNYDPRVMAWDEESKGTVTFSELNNYPVIFRTPLDIRVPVFLVIGSADGIFCSLAAGDMGAPCDTAEHLVASEGPQLGPDVPSVQAHIVNGAGHALNAVRTSQETFAAVQQWIHSTVSGGSHQHIAQR
jgi:pimeloyl-ACP methyl ester carboxylesterase